jgi:MFS family permease
VRTARLAIPLLLATGCAMILTGALSNALLQASSPDALRGRLMAAYSFVVVGMAQVVGAFAGGAVARAAGVDWAVGGGAAIMLAYAVWVYARHPEVAMLGQPRPDPDLGRVRPRQRGGRACRSATSCSTSSAARATPRRAVLRHTS